MKNHSTSNFIFVRMIKNNLKSPKSIELVVKKTLNALFFNAYGRFSTDTAIKNKSTSIIFKTNISHLSKAAHFVESVVRSLFLRTTN